MTHSSLPDDRQESPSGDCPSRESAPRRRTVSLNLSLGKQEFFDHQAAEWDAAARPDMPVRLARVVTTAALQPGMRVLDVGTGTGVLIPPLLEAIGPVGCVLALDNSPEMIAVARGKRYAGSVEFLLADIHDSGLADAAFDAVFCNAALPHFVNKPRALREMARLLRPGGLLVISHPIGREAVNRLHRRVSAVVAEDRVPPLERLGEWLAQVGITAETQIDEPEFYLVAGRKESE